MTYDEWVNTKVSEPVRLGQHLMNTAPEHVYRAACGVIELDPFYVDSPSRLYILNNFLAFAYLVWDESDPEQIAIARKMVLSEPGARR